MTMPTPNLITVNRLKKYFQAGSELVKATDDISFTVKRQEILLIMGPSGSGKTTLLSMLGGLLTPDSGDILIEHDNLATMPENIRAAFRLQHIGFIFQSFNLFTCLNTIDNILLLPQLKGTLNQDSYAYTQELLTLLHLEDKALIMPSKLSGGEKQRVAIARALVNRPQIILADEPTANLDSQNGQTVCRFLKDLSRRDSATVVIVTHDQRITQIADRILWLEDGKIIIRK